jgi:release factor glutamine methyltransferase
MAASEESWTIGRLLNWTADYLDACGAGSPRLDAEVLLAEVRGCERIELYTAFDEVADEPTRAAFRELVRRRAGGEPVAYLVGRREFYAMSFEVTPAVLIPRPETEFLIIALLDLAKPRTDTAPLRIADIGTGSGVLAVTAATVLADCLVSATDISDEALEVARRNAAAWAVADRIDWHLGDLFADLPPEATFDFVLSNPPYVTAEEYWQLSPEVRDHEPRAALLAGKRGTEMIERLVAEATSRVRSGGWLLVEISPMIEQAVANLVASTAGWQLEGIAADQAGLARLARVRRL